MTSNIPALTHDLTEHVEHLALMRLQSADALSEGASQEGMRLSSVCAQDGSAIYYRRDTFGIRRVESLGKDGVFRHLTAKVRPIGRVQNHVSPVNLLATLTLHKNNRSTLRMNMLVCPMDRVFGLTIASLNRDNGNSNSLSSWTFDWRDVGATHAVAVHQVVTSGEGTESAHFSLPMAGSHSSEAGRSIAAALLDACGEEEGLAHFQSFLQRFNAAAESRGHARNVGPREDSSGKDNFKHWAKVTVAVATDVLTSLLSNVFGKDEPGKAAITAGVSALLNIISEFVIDLIADLIYGPDTGKAGDPPAPATDNPPPPDSRWDDPAPSWGDGSKAEPDDANKGDEAAPKAAPAPGGGGKDGIDEPGDHEHED
jgi:hypothetical protein